MTSKSNYPSLLSCCLVLIFSLSAALAQKSPKATSPSVAISYGKLPLSFEANRGQIDPSVQFVSRGQGYTLFLRQGEAVLEFFDTAQATKETSRSQNSHLSADKTSTITMQLVGASNHAPYAPENPQITKTNYFLGNDPRKWRTDIPNYGGVRYSSVYKDIDLVYYGNQRRLEHDFIVAPGADPSQIQLNIHGSDKITIDAQSGDLLLATNSGSVRLLKPFTYQESNGRRTEISSNYRLLAHNQVGFSLGTYNRAKPLIIDPVLTYSTYLGGSGGDQGNGIAVDNAGNAYVVGTTNSIDFPVTNGSYQTQNNSSVAGTGGTVFITKLNAAGTALIYSTYLGGSGGDAGYGIALDAQNNAYITGTTQSIDFPITCAAFQAANPSKTTTMLTAFVTKLNAAGNGLTYSTYLGGSGLQSSYNAGDIAQAIAVDSTGSAYLTGYTFSSDFPISEGAFQAQNAAVTSSLSNAFVTKLNPAGSTLTYSTYLGGTAADGVGDYGNAIAIDSTGDAFVAGSTGSTDFPITQGALQTSGNYLPTGFVTELNPAGTAQVYSTYLGGNGGDSAQAIAVDSSGFTYVAGNTGSNNFPLTSATLEGSNSAMSGYFAEYYGVGIYGTTNGPVVAGSFVTKLSKNGSALVYSTYLEGPNTSITGLAIDATGAAYVTGSAPASGFGLFGGFEPTPDALPAPGSAGYSAFVVKLDPAAAVLNYATLLGGTAQDGARALALDKSGNAYVIGSVTSTDFPISSGAFQKTNHTKSGGSNAFIAKFALATAASSTAYPLPPATQLATSIFGSGSGSETCYPGDSSADQLFMSVWAYLTSAGGGPPLTGAFILTDSLNHDQFNPVIFLVSGPGGSVLGGFPLSDGLPDDAPWGNFEISWSAFYTGDPVYQSATYSGSVSIDGCPAPDFSGLKPRSKTLIPQNQLKSEAASGKGLIILAATTSAKKPVVVGPRFTLPASAESDSSSANRFTARAQATPSTAACSEPPLTVTLHSSERIYGAPNPTFTYTVTGLLNGDTVTITPQTTATPASPAGTYLLTATVTGTAASNYAIQIKDATLYVEKATLRVLPETIFAIYGQPIPTPTVYMMTGFVNGDTQATAVTGTPVFHYSVPTGSPVGQYPLTLTQGTLASTNYTFWFFPYTVQIFKAPLTGTIQNATIHRGQPIPAFTFTWSGFVNGDTATTAVTGAPILSTTATSASPVGHYPITGALGTLQSHNYYFIPVNGILTILP